MNLDLIVPSYQLSDKNIFNIRQNEWDGKIIPNIIEMLKAGEKYGIRVKDIDLSRHPSIDQSEIKKTNSRLLTISMTYGEDKEVNLTYDIPWLINNHFYIGGNKKVSLFQLFDKPVIERHPLIKVRTNVHTFTLIKKSRKRQDYFYYLTVFNKEIPFAKIILAHRCKEEIEELFKCTFGESDIKFKDPRVSANENLFCLLQDINYVLNSDKIKLKELLREYFNRKADSNIIENILLVTEVDIFSKRYFQTDNVIDELIYTISHSNGSVDDCNYDNKRVRFVEQILYSYLCKDIYAMITTLKSARKNSRFSNRSKVILQNANSSSIVQFDHSLNPLSELAMITRLTLSGPGGFEKGNVPSYLRDIHPSMFGRVCPADTGDRDSCGTTEYVVPTIEFDDNLDFPEPKEDCVNSISVSHVPFLEHDDPTRLQMASSQMRHAIMLKKFDVPLIQSGVDGMYTQYTSFIFRADKPGQVVYKNDTILIVQYSNKVCKAFNIGYKKLSQKIYDFYHVYFNVGDKFSKGDIIAESNYLKNGRLATGRNLQTAVMVWHGYNFEDGIIISDRLVKDDVFTSIHFLDMSFEISPNKLLLNLNSDYSDYKPLPNIGDVLKRGDIYAKIKTVSGFGDNNDVIFDDCHDKKVTEDCKIVDIKIYCNKWNSDFPQYNNFIKSFVADSTKNRTDMVENLSSYLTQDELENFLESIEIDRTDKERRRNFKIKGDNIDGIRIEITAVYERPITIGDKVGNRHGNKGIISRILPHEQMPRTEDGHVADIIINPLGIVSRMNIGQLYELHLSQSVSDLKKKIVDMYSKNELTNESLESYILKYIDIIDCTPNKNYTKQMEQYLKSVNVKQFVENINDFYIIQPPFESIKSDELKLAMEYANTKYEYDTCDASVDELCSNNPDIFKKNIINTIAFGFQYFIKLNHIAKDKIASRGVGPYTSKTCQPLEGKIRKGGQRLGEMEVWAIAAQGAEMNLWEFLTTKSDSISRRNKYISEMVNNSDMIDNDDDVVSQALRLFQVKLNTIGLNYSINEEL